MDFILITLGLIAGGCLMWRYPLLKESIYASTELPCVSVIIPARNEAHNIQALITSLQNQSVSPKEIIVVDDHSSDGTGKIARNMGVRVIEATPLPKGWLGKPWACAEGANVAVGDVLLFVDADVVFEEKGIEKALSTYMETQTSFLSIQPYHMTKRPYEQLSAFFNLITAASIGVGFIGQPRFVEKGGYGPVLAVDHRVYLDCGGHERIKTKILEHFELCEIARKSGYRVKAFGGKGAIKFRMYPSGFRELVQGWTKSFAFGAAKTSWPVLTTIILWISGMMTLVGALIGIDHKSFVEAVQLLILYSAFVLATAWNLSKVGRFQWWTSLLFPIPLIIFILIFIRALVLSFGKRRVDWKGRSITYKAKE